MFPKPQRPVGITLLAIMFLWIGGFGTLIFPIFIVTGQTRQMVEMQLGDATHSKMLIVVLATAVSIVWWGFYVLYALIGIGLWKLRRWALKCVVVIQWLLLVLILAITAMLAKALGAVVLCNLGMVLPIAGILWYLHRPLVRWPFEASYAASQGLSIPEAPLSKSIATWLKVVVGLAVAGGGFAVFAGILFYGVESSFRSSDVYRMALAETNASPCVVAKLGQPISGKGLITGEINGGENGTATMDIPIKGTRSEASLSVEGAKLNGTWQISSLTVYVDDGQIHLVPAQSSCQ